MADALGTDLVKVQRGVTLYQLQVGSLASLLDDDLIEVERGGVVYRETGQNVKADLPSGPPAYDPDAQDYITRVETADTEPLEDAVKDAINSYVLALKSDPLLWNELTFLGIHNVARTVNGCLEPLKGVIPPMDKRANLTNGDIVRGAGFKFDGVSKVYQLDPSISPTEAAAQADGLSLGMWVESSNIDPGITTAYPLCARKDDGSGTWFALLYFWDADSQKYKGYMYENSDPEFLVPLTKDQYFPGLIASKNYFVQGDWAQISIAGSSAAPGGTYVPPSLDITSPTGRAFALGVGARHDGSDNYSLYSDVTLGMTFVGKSNVLISTDGMRDKYTDFRAAISAALTP